MWRPFKSSSLTENICPTWTFTALYAQNRTRVQPKTHKKSRKPLKIKDFRRSYIIPTPFWRIHFYWLLCGSRISIICISVLLPTVLHTWFYVWNQCATANLFCNRTCLIYSTFSIERIEITRAVDIVMFSHLSKCSHGQIIDTGKKQIFQYMSSNAAPSNCS